MQRLLVLIALVAVPRLGLASTSSFHLLEKRTLSFAPFGLPLQVEGLLQQEAQSPPPMPPPMPGEVAPATTEEMPSKGKVIALMAVGGGLGVGGVIFIAYGILEFAVSSLYGAACQQSGGPCFGFNPFIVFAVVFEVIGVALEAVGIPLLLVGNAARVRRNEMLSARNVSLSYDPMTRSPLIGYAVHF